MANTEKVSEKVSELRSDLRESVESLKEEVSELKGRLKNLVPGRREEHKTLPVRRESLDPLAEWRRRTDRMFDEMMRGFGMPSLGWFDRPWFGEPMGASWPRIDVEDRDDEVRVTAEIPGIDEKDLDIRLTEDRLTIRGEKRSEREDRREGSFYSSECFYGSFERTIPLGTEVDLDRVEAKFRKGMLTVRLPKTAGAREKTRRIPIRTE